MKCIYCKKNFFDRKRFFLFSQRVCCACKYIEKFSYKPKPKFFGNDLFFFGVELEVTNPSWLNFENFIYENKKEVGSFIYYKHDGSLNRHGLEIVSNPASYDFHKNNFWEKTFYNLNRFGFISDDSCGLHFHINRDSLSERQISILDCLVNNEIFSLILEFLGGRKVNSFCKRAEKNTWGLNYGKYYILNLSNENTIELRFCKSTCNLEDFYLKLEFVFSMLLFSKNQKAKEIFMYGNKRNNELPLEYVNFLKNTDDFCKLKKHFEENLNQLKKEIERFR